MKLSILNFILAFCVGSSVQQYIDTTTEHSTEAFSDFPCPEHVDIFPCKCSYDSIHLDLDCSDVIGNAQLKRIFEARFPTKNYRKFTISHNPHITQLNDILNNVTFTDVELVLPNLSVVSQYFLFDSQEVLESLVISSSSLTKDTFPFTSLPFYKQLENLVIDNASFPDLPKMFSDSIGKMHFSDSKIEHLHEGVFMDSKNLAQVNMDNNQLQFLPKDMMQLEMQDSVVYDISIEANGIELISPQAFKFSTSSYRYARINLNLKDNRLTILEEKVFRDLLYYTSSSSTINIDGNPLRCDCSLAWVFEDNYGTYSPFLDQLSPGATCADGQLLTHLKESDFALC